MSTKIASLGTVSWGTMRPQDLLPSFAGELRALGHRSRELTKIESRINRALNGKYGEDDKYFESEIAQWDIETLCDMLKEHAPAYAYFGASEGDGSDYGFWLPYDFTENDFDGLKVDDLNEIPARYTGEVLEVNDHGNMTLYFCKNGKLAEIWSVC